MDIWVLWQRAITWPAAVLPVPQEKILFRGVGYVRFL
jgi:hypothetical protein